MSCHRFIFCLACLAPASLASADGPEEDHKRLTGSWQTSAGAWSGKALTAEQLRECKLSLTAAEPARLVPARLTLRVPDKLVSYTILVDGSKKGHSSRIPTVADCHATLRCSSS
jgi:hypothetical protein